MKKFIEVKKRLFSVILVLVITVGCIPFGVFGTESVEASVAGSSQISSITLLDGDMRHHVDVSKYCSYNRAENALIISMESATHNADVCTLMDSTERGMLHIKVCSASGDVQDFSLDTRGAYAYITDPSYVILDNDYCQKVIYDLGDEYTGSDSILNKAFGTTRSVYVGFPAHNYSEKDTATCTSAGTKTYTCSAGQHSYSETSKATGHSYKTQVIAPTCTAQGYTKRTCSVCGDTYNASYTPAKGHSYTTQVINSTCTAQGYTKYTCSVCGDTYNDTYIAARGHSYVLKSITASTCTANGNKHYECSMCGATKDEVIDATGHTPSQTKTYLKSAANCTEDAVYFEECSVCHAKLDSEWTDDGTATGHSYEEEPTFNFSEDGKSCTAIYDCKTCDGTKTVTCSVSSEVKTVPTCTEKGVTTYTATAVHPQTEKESTDTKDVADIVMVAHSYEDTVVPPTPSERGYTLHVCSVCGHEEKDNYTDKVTVESGSTGFSEDNNLAGNESDGYKIYLQNVHLTFTGSDGKEYNTSVYEAGTDSTLISGGAITVHYVTIGEDGKETEETEVLNVVDLENGLPIKGDKMYFTFETSSGETITSQEYHKASKDVSVSGIFVKGVKATLADGVYSCKIPCNIDVKGICKDDFGIEGAYGVSIVNTTKNSDGTWTLCISAEDSDYTQNYTVDVISKPHEYKDTVKKPTCTEDGYTEHVCTVCGNSFKDTIVKATGHKESRWIVDRKATNEVDGKRHKECTVCGEVLCNEIISVLNSASISNDATSGAKFNANTATVLEAVLTPEEKESVAAGENVDVSLDAVECDAAPGTIPEGYSTGTGFAVNVSKQVGDSDRITVDCFNSELPVSMAVPADLINTNPNTQREYKVIYTTSKGTTKEVPCNYDAATGEITYPCVGSGTYSLCYRDTLLNNQDTVSESVLKVGTVYTVSGVKYKVASNSKGKETVSVVGLKSKKTTKVAIKDTVKINGVKCKIVSVGNNAFKSAKKLKTVSLGNNITSIGNSAFAGCTALTKATVGKGLTSIGSKAFYGCKKLKTVSIKSTKLKKVGKSALKGVDSRMAINVPAKKVKTYKKLFKSSTGYKKTMKITK